MTEPAPPTTRDGWISLGIAISAISAASSSFVGLRDLAIIGGWPTWLSFLFPLTIDSYSLTATRVWLIKATSSVRARRFARNNAFLAIVLSLAGNATQHLIAAGLLKTSWVIVVAVGACPPLILGLCSHLAVLRRLDPPVLPGSQVRPDGSAPRPRTVEGRSPSSKDRPAVTGVGELLSLARQADAAHRERYGGRPLSRDGLRQALRISGTRATELARLLRAEREAQAS